MFGTDCWNIRHHAQKLFTGRSEPPQRHRMAAEGPQRKQGGPLRRLRARRTPITPSLSLSLSLSPGQGPGPADLDSRGVQARSLSLSIYVVPHVFVCVKSYFVAVHSKFRLLSVAIAALRPLCTFNRDNACASGHFNIIGSGHVGSFLRVMLLYSIEGSNCSGPWLSSVAV